MIAGVLLLMPMKLGAWIDAICEHEIAMGKHEAAFLRIQELASHSLAAITLGVAIYLLAHGLVKLVLITAVMKERGWGYPGLIIFLSIFVLIELIHFAEHRSYAVLVFAFFDIAIVYLAAREYRARRPAEIGRAHV